MAENQMKFVLLLTFGIGASLGAPDVGTPLQPAKVILARASQAQSLPPDVNDAQIEKWMKTWRRRLGLDDWTVTATMVRSWDLKPDTLGNLKWNSGTKTATIRVLNPIDYDLPPGEVPADIEYTVLHELVHLQLALLPRETSSKGLEEQVVNRISEALMALDKGARYRSRTAVAHIIPKDKSISEASRSSQ